MPCHRSHVDYLLLSYVIYQRGYAVPYVAAGVNLNLPVIGRLLRKGGAFFIRRSFRGSGLYPIVFMKYVDVMMNRGHPIEFFIEGGRSRTGRLLRPRTGMLGMTVRSFLRDTRRPVAYVPVYFGYDKLLEGESLHRRADGPPEEEGVGRRPAARAAGVPAQAARPRLRRLRRAAPARRRARPGARRTGATDRTTRMRGPPGSATRWTRSPPRSCAASTRPPPSRRSTCCRSRCSRRRARRCSRPTSSASCSSTSTC